jgi:hypothetical protein
MNKELLSKTIKHIEDNGFSNWNTLVEIANNKQTIEDIWYSKVKSNLIKYFNANLSDNWQHNDCKVWYLKGYSSSSLGVWFENFHIFSVWSSNEQFDNQKTREIFQTKSCNKIYDAFDRIDKRFEGEYKLRELGNFSFQTELDGNYDADTISYFAGTRTEDFCSQLIRKIEKFTNDIEITELFRTINESTKR